MDVSKVRCCFGGDLVQNCQEHPFFFDHFCVTYYGIYICINIYIYIHIICTSIFLIIATIISITRIRIFVSFVFFLVCTKNMDCFFSEQIAPAPTTLLRERNGWIDHRF